MIDRRILVIITASFADIIRGRSGFVLLSLSKTVHDVYS